MGEFITEEAPRIKFEARWEGPFDVQSIVNGSDDVSQLAMLQTKLEKLGVIPILNDGMVGGNCAIRLSTPEDLLLITKSGKQPNVPVEAKDFVSLTSFDRVSWTATFKSPSPEVRPSSDSPLHFAALASDAKNRYTWAEAPLVAIHGHALAEGEGLQAAREAGMPISQNETLFSTPDDLEALEALFIQHPYPASRCFIRKGHGFFLLGKDPADVEYQFETLIMPLLQ